MTPEGKKIWDSRAGGDLAMAMMGEKAKTDDDRNTLETLKRSSRGETTETSPPLPRQKPA